MFEPLNGSFIIFLSFVGNFLAIAFMLYKKDSRTIDKDNVSANKAKVDYLLRNTPTKQKKRKSILHKWLQRWIR